MHFWVLWCLILLTAALLRLSYPDWDQGVAVHPDERFLLGVAYETPIYSNPCAASPEFPYGHLPVTFISLITKLAPHDPLYSARLLSGVGGVFLVALTGCCGFRLSRSRAGGLLAGLLAAFCPFFIQQAHFYTVDPWAAIFGTLALLLAMREKWSWSGVFVGLSLACKASSVWIGVSIGVAMMVVTRPCQWMRNGLSFLSGVLAAVFVGSPWLILAPIQCWRGPLVQAQLAAGRFVFPYTQQYARTIPWVYPFTQMFLWSMGAPVTLAGIISLSRLIAAWRETRRPYLIALVAMVFFFVVTSGFYVKYPRYLLAIYPLWIGFAVKGLLDLHHALRSPLQRVGGLGVILTTILITCGLGLAQASVYRGIHPWVEASRWIYQHVAEDSTLVAESWDHPLPVPLASGDPSNYQQITLPVLDGVQGPDVKAKVLDRSREARVVVLASRRNYGVVLQQPERFEVAHRWYEELFRERRVLVFSRCPRIGGLALSDDPFQGLGGRGIPNVREYCDANRVFRLPRLDESFRVYDAPITILLVRDD